MRSINLKKKIVFTKKAIALGLSFAIATAGVNFISDTVHAAEIGRASCRERV